MVTHMLSSALSDPQMPVGNTQVTLGLGETFH